jgi:antitoxin MazE
MRQKMYILRISFWSDIMPSGAIEKISKVARWGNSLGFRIPREGVEKLKLKDGQSVVVRVSGDAITIRRSKARKKWTEKELLKGITPRMCGPDLVPNRAGKELL